MTTKYNVSSLIGSWIQNKKPFKEHNGHLVGKYEYEISATQKYSQQTHANHL